MAAFYSARRHARAFLARAAARASLFLAIAAALLAGVASLAPAQASAPAGGVTAADGSEATAADGAEATSGEESATTSDGSAANSEDPAGDASGTPAGDSNDEPGDPSGTPEGETPAPPPGDPTHTGSDDDKDGDGEKSDDKDGESGNGNPGKDDDDEAGDGNGAKPDQGGTANPDAGSDQGTKSEPVAAPALPALPTTPAVAAPQAQNQDQPREERSSQRRSGSTQRGTARGGSDGPGAGSADVPGTGAGVAGATDSSTGATAPSGGSGGSEDAASGGTRPDDAARRDSDEGSPVTRTVTRTVKDIVEVVPESAKVAVALLAALAVLLGTGYLLSAVRARRLTRQRRDLLQEVGLLQGALLPAVPATLGALRTSVAYRPAEGIGAGGDFYDVIPLSSGRVGFILGDVSGHGRSALARTAFMRYTLRAYLEAGLEPRVALQVAGRVIDDNLGGDFATVLIAVHDPESGALTYASAGHPAPIVTGPEHHEPVTAASSPPIGVGVRTGLRQTTVPLEPGSVACLFTDGLTEARTADGILGRERLEELVAELGREGDADALLAAIAAEARVLSDDMATCLITPTTGVTTGGFRTEQLELSARELDGPLAGRFLDACGISTDDAERVLTEARGAARQFGGVVLHVVLGNRSSVEVLPRNVESIEAASRRVAAAR